MRKATETQKLSSCPTKKKKKSHHEAGDVHLLAGLLDGGGPLAQAGGLEDLAAAGGHLLAGRENTGNDGRGQVRVAEVEV